MELTKAAARLGIELNEAQLNQFKLYTKLLLEWNEKINLTAITNPDEIVLKHYADCLSLVSVLTGENLRILDVGSGAGFPGMVLKIALPQAEVVLLDSLNKRITFLHCLIRELGLENITAIHGRAEELGKASEHREQYNFVVSRAVANLSSLAEYCLPFAKIGGKFLSMKASVKNSDTKAEVSAANKAIFELGGEISDIKPVQIPFTDIEHSLIIISKKRHTPQKYPRKAVKIAKTPIL